MNSSVAINAYANVGLSTDIMSADPHKLTSMLFEGALLAIARARHAMNQGQPAAKGQSISKAIAIIGEGLNASLDKEAGGEMARNLSSLYDYMVGRLVHANIKNDASALDEVARLLTELKDAWDSIRPQVAQPAGPAGYARA
jgi:flagellar protein FliS